MTTSPVLHPPLPPWADTEGRYPNHPNYDHDRFPQATFQEES